mmetsp:Transcript_72394/g.204624  ORF Transcript_72394/g.204624 Transcript_72394/m.204624 type:complete len:285 (+) Transcript_72394:420-1274(+)
MERRGARAGYLRRVYGQARLLGRRGATLLALRRVRVQSSALKQRFGDALPGILGWLVIPVLCVEGGQQGFCAPLGIAAGLQEGRHYGDVPVRPGDARADRGGGEPQDRGRGRGARGPEELRRRGGWPLHRRWKRGGRAVVPLHARSGRAQVGEVLPVAAAVALAALVLPAVAAPVAARRSRGGVGAVPRRGGGARARHAEGHAEATEAAAAPRRRQPRRGQRGPPAGVVAAASLLWRHRVLLLRQGCVFLPFVSFLRLVPQIDGVLVPVRAGAGPIKHAAMTVW